MAFVLQAKLLGSCCAYNETKLMLYVSVVTQTTRCLFLYLQQMLYVVVWCAVFSTLHLYVSVADYWVLCLCVSLVAIFLTTAIIFILHYSNNQV